MPVIDGSRPQFPSNSNSYVVNRRRFRYLTVIYVVLFVGGLLYHSRDSVQTRTNLDTLEYDLHTAHTQNASCDSFESLNFLLGPPTPSFRGKGHTAIRIILGLNTIPGRQSKSWRQIRNYLVSSVGAH